MAQNLFEKYGIKEVADVTLYRIERKDETFESQRKISISSILKGALTKEVVFPLDEDGIIGQALRNFRELCLLYQIQKRHCGQAQEWMLMLMGIAERTDDLLKACQL